MTTGARRDRLEESGAWRGDIERRVAAVEREVVSLGDELRTRRIVVHDDEGRERIVGEVVGGTAELRVELGDGPGMRSAVVIVASSFVAGRGPDDDGMGPAVAVQLWTEGETVAELDAWPDEEGRWRPHLHLGAGI